MLQVNRSGQPASSEPPQRMPRGCHHPGHRVGIASSTARGTPPLLRKHPREYPSHRMAKSECSVGNAAADIATTGDQRAWTLLLSPAHQTGTPNSPPPSNVPLIEATGHHPASPHPDRRHHCARNLRTYLGRRVGEWHWKSSTSNPALCGRRSQLTPAPRLRYCSLAFSR
jgi:hypothetical protein